MNGSSASSAAKLNHPNVVTAYDANELAERFYLVLEFVDGPDFEALVRARGLLPVAEACELARQAAVGLDHAHARGMVHRDVKPANLLVARPSQATPEPLVKIADFGIAKLGPSQTPAPGGPWLGTPDYVAPEQAHDPAAADPRSDLYSLGAVLFFLLTGRPPFPGGTAEEKVRRHLWEEPPRLEALRPDVPPPLAALVHQLLAKHPGYRPATAAEVAARLAAIAAAPGEAISFDLPAAHAGQYSFAAGQLSGSHAAPSAPAVPAAETSPWDAITVPLLLPDGEPAGAAPRRAAAGPAGLPAWLLVALAAGMVALCAGAVGLLMKTLAR